MVVKVPLRGLKIVRSRGKWYVYHRASGDAIVRGFDGSRNDLTEHATLCIGNLLGLRKLARLHATVAKHTVLSSEKGGALCHLQFRSVTVTVPTKVSKWAID